MSIKVKAGGVWKDVTGVYVKRGGVYRQAQGIYGKSGGALSANYLSGPPAMRAVSDRLYTHQTKSTTNKYMGGYRTIKILSAVTALEAEFANWFVDGYGGPGQTYLELGSGGPANWTASVEYPAGTFTQFKTAGNSATLTLADGAQGTMYATVSIPAGAEVKIHFLQAQTGSGFVVHAGGPTQSGTPGTTNTSSVVKDTLRANTTAITDATMTGNWAAAGGNNASGNACGPIRISGLTSKPSVLIYGTSIDYGEWGTELVVYNSGLAGQQLSDAGFGFTNAGIRGESIQTFLASDAKRIALGNSGYYTHILFGGPVNDIQLTSRTAAQIFADMRTQWALFPGKKLMQQTMTPMTTAADGQTPIARAQVWRDLNTLIRGNTDGVIVFDVAAAMEAPGGPPETCQWATTTISQDGVHPNDSGYDRNRASGSIDTSKILA